MRNTIDDIAQLFAALAEQLIFWRDIDDDALAKKISGSVERKLLISRARDWIEAHLHQHFQIAELAAELHISPRTLQYCFVDELGHSPLAEVRRFRFRLLGGAPWSGINPPFPPRRLSQLGGRISRDWLQLVLQEVGRSVSLVRVPHQPDEPCPRPIVPHLSWPRYWMAALPVS